MRDWAKSLRRASYRGVSFWVEGDDFSGGKRIAVHEYAGGRDVYIEEMGLSAPMITVTAYLAGDFSDVAATALIAACQATGPGLLVLPSSSGQLAYVESFSRSFEKDRLGYVAFNLSAIPVGNSPIAALGVGDINAVVSAGIGAAAVVLKGFF